MSRLPCGRLGRVCPGKQVQHAGRLMKMLKQDFYSPSIATDDRFLSESLLYLWL